MIKEIITINNANDLIETLKDKGLLWKSCWTNYVWLDKTYYYRLVIFSNGDYGLFTQSQLPIVEAHPEIESSYWRDYKPYADKGYKVMRYNGVDAGSKESDNIVWTPIKKKEFRQTKQWKDFKNKIIKDNCYVKCQDCGKEINPANIEVHHLRPDLYDCLRPYLFKLLCSECHSNYTKKGL